MDMNPKTKSKTDAPQQFHDMAEKGATQSKEVFEKMSAATGQGANVMQNCYSTALKGAQDYNSTTGRCWSTGRTRRGVRRS